MDAAAVVRPEACAAVGGLPTPPTGQRPVRCGSDNGREFTAASDGGVDEVPGKMECWRN